MVMSMLESAGRWLSAPVDIRRTAPSPCWPTRAAAASSSSGQSENGKRMYDRCSGPNSPEPELLPDLYAFRECVPSSFKHGALAWDLPASNAGLHIIPSPYNLCRPGPLIVSLQAAHINSGPVSSLNFSRNKALHSFISDLALSVIVGLHSLISSPPMPLPLPPLSFFSTL